MNPACEHDLVSVEDHDLPYYCWHFRCRKCGVECGNPSELEDAVPQAPGSSASTGTEARVQPPLPEFAQGEPLSQTSSGATPAVAACPECGWPPDWHDEIIEECAKVCENYGLEGDGLSKEYAHETAAELAARIRRKLRGEKPSIKLGIVAAVKHEIDHGNHATQRYWHQSVKGLSAAMHVALGDTTHDSNEDTVVMHYCTEGNEILKRIYQEGR